MAESEEELKEENVKAGWKLNIQKTKIMASSPITSWQTKGEKMETMTDFIFLGSKITVDSDCCHEVKRHLILGRTPRTRLASILKIRHHFANKVHLVKATVFSSSHVQM